MQQLELGASFLRDLVCSRRPFKYNNEFQFTSPGFRNRVLFRFLQTNTQDRIMKAESSGCLCVLYV